MEGSSEEHVVPATSPAASGGGGSFGAQDAPSARPVTRPLGKRALSTNGLGQERRQSHFFPRLFRSDLPPVPKLEGLASGKKSPTSPSALSPGSPSAMSPTNKAMGAFGIHSSDLKGVAPNTLTGEVEIDGIPDEHWDIRFEDLVILKELAEGTFGRVYMVSLFAALQKRRSP